MGSFWSTGPIEAERFEDTGGARRVLKSGLRRELRHELVAYWLGVTPSEMPWQRNESFSVIWTTKSAYESELGLMIKTDIEKMFGILEQLKSRHLFDERMAKGTFPR